MNKQKYFNSEYQKIKGQIEEAKQHKEKEEQKLFAKNETFKNGPLIEHKINYNIQNLFSLFEETYIKKTKNEKEIITKIDKFLACLPYELECDYFLFPHIFKLALLKSNKKSKLLSLLKSRFNAFEKFYDYNNYIILSGTLDVLNKELISQMLNYYLNRKKLNTIALEVINVLFKKGTKCCNKKTYIIKYINLLKEYKNIIFNYDLVKKNLLEKEKYYKKEDGKTFDFVQEKTQFKKLKIENPTFSYMEELILYMSCFDINNQIRFNTCLSYLPVYNYTEQKFDYDNIESIDNFEIIKKGTSKIKTPKKTNIQEEFISAVFVGLNILNYFNFNNLNNDELSELIKYIFENTKFVFNKKQKEKFIELFCKVLIYSDFDVANKLIAYFENSLRNYLETQGIIVSTERGTLTLGNLFYKEKAKEILTAKIGTNNWETLNLILCNKDGFNLRNLLQHGYDDIEYEKEKIYYLLLFLLRLFLVFDNIK